MEKKDKVRFSIRLKIFLAIMGLSFTTLILLAYEAFSDLYKLENYAIESGDRLGESAMKDSEISLETLYKTGIRNKAIDVAKQLEIYLNDRPHMTTADLKADDRFREMANQVVGETGYTAVMDTDQFVFLVHQFFEYEDSDLTLLKSKLPSFWAVIETLRGGGPSSGYYDWQEPDGTISKKYAYIAPIKASTADGKKGLTLWATTYIWEFSRPVESTKAKIREAIWDTRDKITAQKRRMIRNIIGIFAAIIFIVLATSYALSRKITQPILTLSNGVKMVGSGNLDVFLEVKTGDEIENLADAFNKMTGDLKAHIQSLNETTASKERIQSRLDVADTILKSLREVTSEILEGSDIRYSFEWLFPHMRVETFKKGDYLFHKGDKADKILYVKEGKLRLVEINKTLGAGALIGETGFLSPSRERTMSVLCEEDSEIYTMHEDKAIEIFHSDPSLVLKMIQ
ncbi:MAG: cyclic nucleotide-binding domain-containing protein, partial [Pseudomonadota bacterium]